ncbi:ADP-ribosylation factor-binding protein GGA1-like [Eriocheir sinensis]|uniref:ADP-ribosylation factor-binding protein GGA1-like n=1 Tax=Eriocheir sinensis TaxID=95602 RepID=UPI0021C64589|nr:ADP-ribosylation factor-binding protein GGA1-like [Eriocheir sinensis]
MAGPPAPTLEVLIQKCTSPLNAEDDPNAIQAVCQAVLSEPSGVSTAVRLLAHKIQSPQEREALQALSVLQACANNCGSSFHNEIGKFKFLNEMIKLVSPKYLGNHTHPAVKERVVELLYSWTLDLKGESKILEAYNMLKKQGVVKADPRYLGAPTLPEPRPRPNAVFEDEEKSRLLQKLLQSKNPEDLHKANALIKSMVKEDERRMERSSRRIVEVETALNNVRVLDEMLSRHQESPASQADLDLMQELNSSCASLRTNLYRLVSEMDDKDEGIGDLLKANDELSRVMGRYKLVVEGTRMETSDSGSGSTALSSSNRKDSSHDDGEILLDLSTPEEAPATQTSASMINKNLEEIGLENLNLSSGKVESDKSSSSLLEDLGSIFPSSSSPALALSTPVPNLMSPTLIPQASTKVPDNEQESENKGPVDPLGELGEFGSSLIRQSLPPNTPVQINFKTAEKLSMNQMKQQQLQQQQLGTTPTIAPTNNCSVMNLSKNAVPSPTPPSVAAVGVSAAGVSGSSTERGNGIDSLLNLDLLSGGDLSSDIHLTTTTTSTAATITTVDALGSLLDDRPLVNDSKNLIGSVSPSVGSEAKTSVKNTKEPKPRVKEDKENRITTAKPQFMEVKPMTDIKVTLDNIKPGKQAPVTVLDSNDISVTLHFTENQPREDVAVVVVSVVSRNYQPVTNYVLQAVAPKGCKVRLQAPSAASLSPYSPFLPPPAITQIMLIANPNKLNVSLKVMLSYTLEDDPVTEMAEVESLPL